MPTNDAKNHKTIIPDRTKHTTIQDDIDDDYKTAFKKRNEAVFIVLRPVLAVIKQATIDRRKELTNEEIIQILRSEVKKRREAMEQFKAGGRDDLVQQAEHEIEIISQYLPAQMTDEQLEDIIKTTIKEIGAVGPQDTGKAMGAVMSKVNGQADGGRVKELVQKTLAEVAG